MTSALRSFYSYILHFPSPSPSFIISLYIIIMICLLPLIDIAALESQYPSTTFIIVNGNLDRLRTSYYPPLFYPKLANVSKSFYSRFTQVFFLSPVAVLGDRFGSWIATQYPGSWELLVLQPNERKYDVVHRSDRAFDSTKVWKEATRVYKQRTGRMF